MIDNYDPTPEIVANGEEYRRLRAICEQAADLLDGDYREKEKDGMAYIIDEGVEPGGGDLAYSTRFVAERSWDKQESPTGEAYLGEDCTYMLISTIETVIAFEALPALARDRILELPYEAREPSQTQYLVRYRQNYVLSDTEDFEFKYEIVLLMDGIEIISLEQGDSNEEVGIPSEHEIDDEFAAMLSGGDFNELMAWDKNGIVEEGQLDILELHRAYASGAKLCSRKEHLRRARNLLNQLPKFVAHSVD